MENIIWEKVEGLDRHELNCYGVKIVLAVCSGTYKQKYISNLDRRFFFVDGKEVEINLYGVGKKNGKGITILGEGEVPVCKGIFAISLA